MFLAGDSNFIKTLINFDKNNISTRVLKRIGQFCMLSDFQPDVIGKVSLAAKSLCMWVRAMEVRSSISVCKLLRQRSLDIIIRDNNPLCYRHLGVGCCSHHIHCNVLSLSTNVWPFIFEPGLWARLQDSGT